MSIELPEIDDIRGRSDLNPLEAFVFEFKTAEPSILAITEIKRKYASWALKLQAVLEWIVEQEMQKRAEQGMKGMGFNETS